MKLTNTLLLGAIFSVTLLLVPSTQAAAEKRRTISTSSHARSSSRTSERVYRGRLAPRYSDHRYYGRPYYTATRYVIRRPYLGYYDYPYRYAPYDYYDDYYYGPGSYYGPGYSSGVSFSFGRSFGGRNYHHNNNNNNHHDHHHHR